MNNGVGGAPPDDGIDPVGGAGTRYGSEPVRTLDVAPDGHRGRTGPPRSGPSAGSPYSERRQGFGHSAYWIPRAT